ncbi:uncharacterized protein LOC110110891 [Dendrobium catenatum]|uniref:Sororin C-terminal region domain-containing protein n=1 Tax=Dendrobium catenatum TaxID=906689 RepID=A0A2I0WJV5_9ASPA|nr:uncharacterized protein LOC110110891 [Dendrobium catenatum]PKU75945.1 hypothetical protein MA16_Dca005992 [Dendrobium catenatum]
MQANSSEGMSLRPRRKPLADLTNTSSLRFSAATESRKPEPKPKVSPEYFSSKSSVSSAGSSDPKNTGVSESPKSTFVAKGTSTISVSSVASSIKCDFVRGKNGGGSTVKLQYVRKKQKEQKDVSLAAASSAPPLGRTQRFRKKLLMKVGMNQNEAYSEPYQKKKKRQRCLGSAGSRLVDKDIPLQDFIQKQRAYFAEVDSFELPEEVVSESELE